MFLNPLLIYRLVASDKHFPVTIPRCAALCCKIMSMIVDNVTIHNNVYPYPEPAAILLAQLPGSLKPTVTSKPGPTYLRKFIASFVDDLKNDAKTDDKEISDMNQKLIAEGEKTISNIDARLKNLDNLPKDIYSKSQDDFIRAVDEATKVKDNTTNDFNNLLDEMNKALGINPNAMQNPGTMSNTNKNTNTDTKK